MSAAPSTPARLRLFRALLVVAAPLVFFLGLEFTLRVAGYGHDTAFFIPDTQPGYLRTNPAYTARFMPGSFDLRPLNFRVAAKKPANTLRIVVLGESAAQGIPVPAFGFAPQLRALLRARYPDKTIEVINTGVVAINSHVVYQIARDAAQLSPDLFVVYMGNNEVVGPYGPGCSYLSAMPPLWIIRASVWAKGTRTGQLLGALVGRFAGAKRAAPEWGGMTMFMDHAVRGDDPRLEKANANFEANLRAIVRVANGSGAKTVFCTVVSNLKDCPPFLSLHRTDLGEADLAAWQRTFQAGRLAWKLGDTAAAQAALQEAWRLDPHYADTAFMLGSLAQQSGQRHEARKYFLEAQQWDALRFRPVPRLNEIARAIAREQDGVTLVDTALALGSDPAATDEITGRELMLEHVHPDWEGNRRIAFAMAQGVEQALAQPGKGPWLDAAGTAAAVGYTPAESFGVLQRITLITRNPPFPGQLTYAEDQARTAREMGAAEAVRRDGTALRRAAAVVAAAVRRDPDNPDLAKIDLELADELGDTAAALEKARRLQALSPANFALATDVAIKLSRLARYDEAEQLLQQTARAATPPELIKMGPAFVDLYTRTKRFADGRHWADAALAQYPQAPSLRLFRGRLAQAGADADAAERDYRAVLAADPASEPALEYLVALLNEKRRTQEAETISVEHAGFQPGNQANHLRVAEILEARGDKPGAGRALQAAMRSGPVPVPTYLHLVNLLYDGKRSDEVLDYLATASRLAREEGDAEAAAGIRQLISRMQAGP